MTRTRRPSTIDLVRAIILIGVVVCLCVSVGEGLRLTPFPTPSMARDAIATGNSGIRTSAESSVPKYGPVYVPTRLHKGNKRQSVDYFYPPFQVNHALAVTRVSFRGGDQDDRVSSAHFILNLADRAPPSLGLTDN